MSSEEKNTYKKDGYGQGRYRKYRRTEVPYWQAQSPFTKLDYVIFVVLFVIGTMVRLYNIADPGVASFGEKHYCQLVKRYFEKEFFVDIHPPLGKLVYFWIARISGWNGEFNMHDMGDKFEESFPYLAMRLFLALCGVYTVVGTYYILRVSLCRRLVSLFGSLLVLFENSFITQSRFILLDSPLIACITYTIAMYLTFQNSNPFSRGWKFFLVCTGVGLGISASIKLASLFVFAWIFVLTGFQLWEYLGDLEVLLFQLAKHIFYRIICLILVPIAIYLSIFSLHFRMLTKPTPEIGEFSPRFKVAFEDSGYLTERPAAVVSGSKVTLKHNGLEKYLHSHDYHYPSGTQEQQVSLYGGNFNSDNEWILVSAKENLDESSQNLKAITHGEEVRLLHKNTGKYLHVLDVRPPLSEHDYAYEISCSTYDNNDDSNYLFRVRIVRTKVPVDTKLPFIKLRATQTLFQLINRNNNCYLLSHPRKLPSWGFRQNEVLCIEGPTMPNSLWYVEENSHPLLDDDLGRQRILLTPPSFWEKVLEYHQVMARRNRAITEEHPEESSPEKWPITLAGIVYHSSKTEESLSDSQGSQVYFLGNLAIYYISVLAILFITVLGSLKFLLFQLNPYKESRPLNQNGFIYANVISYALGWYISYLPMFHLNRQLFLYHYLVALYFAILTTALSAEYIIGKTPILGYFLVMLSSALSLRCFYQFLPLIYGLSWSRQACISSIWFDSWQFDCGVYN